MRKLRSFLIVIFCIFLVGCGARSSDDPVVQTIPTDPSEAVSDHGKLTLLFTSDIHNLYAIDAQQGNIGYAALTAYKNQLIDDGHRVVMIDGGDAVALSSNLMDHMDSLMEIVAEAEYDYRIPGDRELKFGLDAINSWTDGQDSYQYLSCNIIDKRTGEPVFTPYEIVEYDGVKVAYLGITTPNAAIASKYYSFSDDSAHIFYDTIQRAIDDARSSGADYVIAIGHTGTNPDESPWSTAEIIANTTGITVYLDGHSESVIEGTVVVDMDDHEVPVCAVGADFLYVGQIELDLNSGEVSVTLLQDLTEEDRTVKTLADDLTEVLKEAQTEPETTEATEPTQADE